MVKTTCIPWRSPLGTKRLGTWGFRLVSGLDTAGTPLCMTLQQLPPGYPQAVKIAVLSSHRVRALSATVACWRTSPSANGTARVKRDPSRHKNSHETEGLGANSQLVCNTGGSHISASTYHWDLEVRTRRAKARTGRPKLLSRCQ
jgi:hypothetical protein